MSAESILEPYQSPKEEGAEQNEPGPRLGRVVVMCPGDGREPGPSVSEEFGSLVWSAVTTPWHPRILASLETLPRVEPLETPTDPRVGEVRIVVGPVDSLPESYRQQAKLVDAPLVAIAPDRGASVELVAKALESIGYGSAAHEPTPEQLQTAESFMALGIVQHWLRDLTTAMGKIDQLDSDQLSKELFAAARAWLDNDIGAAEGGLRAAYEILIQTRERFYSVDAYIVDMCLLDSTSPSGSLAPYLEGRSPFSILASGRASNPMPTESQRRSRNCAWRSTKAGRM